MKTLRKSIDSFLSAQKIAVAGASRNQKKFGYTVTDELLQRGYEVYPVNPVADLIGEKPSFKSISSLPADVKNLVIVTKKDQTESVMREAVAHGITSVWIQQMSETPEAFRVAEENHIDLVGKQCILMWLEPVKSIHKFHRAVKKLFGLLPK